MRVRPPQVHASEAMEVFDELMESEVSVIVQHLSDVVGFCLEVSRGTQVATSPFPSTGGPRHVGNSLIPDIPSCNFPGLQRSLLGNPGVRTAVSPLYSAGEPRHPGNSMSPIPPVGKPQAPSPLRGNPGVRATL